MTKPILSLANLYKQELSSYSISSTLWKSDFNEMVLLENPLSVVFGIATGFQEITPKEITCEEAFAAEGLRMTLRI